MDIASILIGLVSGGAGGAGAGAMLKEKGLGMVGNLLAGGAGGLLSGAGGISIASLIPALGNMLGATGGGIVGGGLNGLILTAVIGFVKSKMAK